MSDDPNADDILDDDDDEEGSSKNRASKEITELYYFILSLGYNQVKFAGLRKEGMYTEF
jgi:hypothetical protein